MRAYAWPVHDAHTLIGAWQYLVATRDPLAITYNDRAVLESMHTSEFFQLLHKVAPPLRIVTPCFVPSCHDSRLHAVTAVTAVTTVTAELL